MLEIVGLFKPKRIQLISLGCSKNRADSEKLLYRLGKEQLEIIAEDESYEDSRPDAIIINTCGFIKSAKQESIDEILMAAKAKENGWTQKIIVCGCLSERYKDLNTLIPEVDAFFGTNEWDAIVEYITGKSNRKKLDNQVYGRAPKQPYRHYAYLKISDGCNRKCSYCAIPQIKGKYISFPMEQLVEEAQLLAKDGVRELIIIAQDTTYYGMDLYGKRMIAPLIDKISKIKEIEWIRIHYSYPLSFPRDLIALMASNPKVCKYIDIPLQHSNTMVLNKMRRGIDFERTQKIISDLRKNVHSVAIRTTLIVGHPGEGDKEFEELLEFVKANRFEMLGAFTYSEEENTYAAIHYKDTVPESEKQRRYDKLMRLQRRIHKSINKKRIGGVEKVIIDDYTDGYFICRSQRESPEVDGVILVECPMGSKKIAPEEFIGKFAAVKIVGMLDYDLIAEFA